jgi:predicted pyridoxine 5'-phosphate oxidase superfamily flavin-nucleotide-binding protein
MSNLFSETHRRLQQRFDTERLADRIEERLVRPALTDEDAQFIAARDMFFLATADAEGRPNCSYKGGDPGFVRVLEPGTLAFPNYDGNGMYLSMGNALANAHVGLLFIDFESPRRLRVNGVASLDDSLAGEWPEAQFGVRVEVREVFPNCPRYIHRMRLVERSAFTPHADAVTPVPGWKRMAWASDVLPAGDPARQPDRDT